MPRKRERLNGCFPGPVTGEMKGRKLTVIVEYMAPMYVGRMYLMQVVYWVGPPVNSVNLF